MKEEKRKPKKVPVEEAVALMAIMHEKKHAKKKKSK